MNELMFQLTYAGRTPGPALAEVEENDARWSADGCVLAGERQAAGARIDAESGDRIASLVAQVEIVARGVDIEAARVVASCPFLGDIRQLARRVDGEEGDAVVQAVGGIDDLPLAETITSEV